MIYPYIPAVAVSAPMRILSVFPNPIPLTLVPDEFKNDTDVLLFNTCLPVDIICPVTVKSPLIPSATVIETHLLLVSCI